MHSDRIFEKQRILTLSNMNEFAAQDAFESIRLIAILGQLLENAEDVKLDDETRRNIEGILDNAEALYAKVGIEPAFKQIKRIKAKLNEDPVDFLRLKHMLSDAEFWAKDGFSTGRFYHLSQSEDDLYKNTHPFGESVTLKLPECAFDIEESAKCRALDRPTASVLHLMRTVDTTLNLIGKPLGVDTASNPSWYSMRPHLNYA